ncbi:MAG: hypothetical protein K6U04_16175 [Armatimonadetes bacterium]|nr:hypothetical protein [Armatimonadota bacterium]
MSSVRLRKRGRLLLVEASGNGSHCRLRVTYLPQEKPVRGENTFVRSGKRHRLENPGKVVLEVIKVQLGEYLAEDGIVRFEDDFGRGWV